MTLFVSSRFQFDVFMSYLLLKSLPIALGVSPVLQIIG